MKFFLFTNSHPVMALMTIRISRMQIHRLHSLLNHQPRNLSTRSSILGIRSSQFCIDLPSNGTSRPVTLKKRPKTPHRWLKCGLYSPSQPKIQPQRYALHITTLTARVPKYLRTMLNSSFELVTSYGNYNGNHRFMV